jgi:hypothetical protein
MIELLLVWMIMCILKHRSHTHPDGHSDIIQDQVLKKKSKKLFFLAGVILNKTWLFFCQTAPLAHLSLH